MIKRIALTLSAALLCAGAAHAEVFLKGTEIAVADRAKAIKFYAAVLDYKVVTELIGKDKTELTAGETIMNPTGKKSDVISNSKMPLIALLPLCGNHCSDKDDPKKKTEGRTRYGNLAIGTTDVPGLLEKVKANGGTVVRTNGTSFAMVTDPDGYDIEIFQHQPPAEK